MAMSDCIKCWDTPCECGYDYKDWSEDRLKDLISTLQEILDKKEENQNEKRNM